MTYIRKATQSELHLQNAATSISIAAGHLTAARESDPNDDATYRELIKDAGSLSTRIQDVLKRKRPDLDREAQQSA